MTRATIEEFVNRIQMHQHMPMGFAGGSSLGQLEKIQQDVALVLEGMKLLCRQLAETMPDDPSGLSPHAR